MLSESLIYQALEMYRATATIQAGVTELHIKLEPEDLHRRTSPDFILWVTVSLSIFSQLVSVRVPILVEAEKGGLKLAIEDLDKFVERREHYLRCPFLVVAERGYDSQNVMRAFPTEVVIKQIPSRNVTIPPKSQSEV